MNATITVGLDLAKNVFYALALGEKSKEHWRKKLQRAKVLEFFANQPLCCIAMEACGGAHYWARELRKHGHTVILLPPQHVKGYLKGQKNDYNDARAIAEACQHGAIRPVMIKSIEQQDEQAFHRIRKSLVKEQTAIINQTRGFLAENGLVIGRSKSRFRKALPEILEDASNGLSDFLRGLLHRQYQRFCVLETELDDYLHTLKRQAANHESLQRLQRIRGFGPINSSEFASWLGDGKPFSKGRDASAALGLVPKQHSSGGKIVLLGITKKGAGAVRSQVVHGARAVVSQAKRQSDPLSQWINRLVATRGFNKAVIAYANKMARMGWVILARGEHYDPARVAGHESMGESAVAYGQARSAISCG